MFILGLDLATTSGYSLIQGDSGCIKPELFQNGLIVKNSSIKLLEHGAIKLDRPVAAFDGGYPFGYIKATTVIAEAIIAKIKESEQKITPQKLDLIVIEETNPSRARLSQKILEQIHCLLLFLMPEEYRGRVKYISTSEWRKILNQKYSDADKKNNKTICKARALSRNSGIPLNEAKKALGVRGKVTKKHVSVRFVNEFFGLNLLAKDDDVSDAICLALAALFML
jgi:hypothetical protein